MNKKFQRLNILDFVLGNYSKRKKYQFFCKGGSRMIKERKLRKNLSKVGIVKD